MSVGLRPWSEAERLAALHGYDILDQPLDAQFDDFVQIAAQVCEAPIAVVNLIDQGRQWFAAERGLGVRETPLDVSICAHAILQPGVFVIPDLTQDGRFNCNPLVTGDPRLRFYGGALLETPEGLPLGTMCVLDYEARPQGLTERQAFTLRALARQVMTQLELRRAVAEKALMIQEAHHRVKNSLQMVQSLLNLQARSAADPEAAQQLRESAGRINTFGALHEHLYRFGAAARIDLADYLGGLVDGQDEALASTFEGREIVLVADRITWPSSDAPSLGVIVFELVTNALKYGAGRVTVTLRSQGEVVVLSVEDEGRDLPADFDPFRSKGLGMRVITSLLRGRQGHLALDQDRPNTRFIVRLPMPADRAIRRP
ncbi:sensor histidine kinase [Falsiroseomonas sp. E2-1-a20]|uniref:sensor histidine kinase n=1 Tax=Falsiroseomonas sp. E2-1-a20 TaxID=3239300 RepID=UPI003F3F1A50